MRRAASRAAWTAGSKRAINTAMMAMTTSSSISAKPGRGVMSRAPGRENGYRETEYRGPLQGPRRVQYGVAGELACRADEAPAPSAWVGGEKRRVAEVSGRVSSTSGCFGLRLDEC